MSIACVAVVVAICIQCSLAAPSTRIVGGHPIDITTVPWHVQLRDGVHYKCGASIIRDQWILTAAQCVDEEGNYTIVAGATKLDNDGIAYAIERIVSHPSYDIFLADYDFAVIKLQKKLLFSDKIQPVKMFEVGDVVENDRITMVAGWGLTENPDESRDILRVVKVPVVSQEQCIEAYSETPLKITPRMICAGLYDQGGKDACRGDAGGALVIYDDDKKNTMQVGVVSAGYGCGKPQFPGVYARVSSVRAWIDDIVSG